MAQILLDGGIITGLFLAIVLVSMACRRKRVRQLALLMVLAATAILVQERAIAAGTAGALAFSGLLDFLLAPFVYLFVRAFAASTAGTLPLRRKVLHLAPFLLAGGFAGLMTVFEGPSWRQPDSAAGSAALAFWTAGRFAVYGFYLTTCLPLMRELKLNGRGETAAAVSGMRLWLSFLGMAALMNMASTAAYTAGWINDPLIRLACTGLLSLSTFGLGYLLMVHPVLRGAVSALRTGSKSASPPLHRARLRRFLVTDKAYLDPDLCLEDIMRATGLSRDGATAALQAEFGERFYDCLARLRHEEFLRLCLIPGNRSRPVLDLAFEAGFNSKAVFYRTFRRFETCTPRQYRSAVPERSRLETAE